MEYNRNCADSCRDAYLPRDCNKLFSEEERADIVALVAADPECGDLIRGTGGFRKVRVARRDGEEWRCAGCVYLAQREIPGFSDHGFSEE
jgi:hypothetical protein